MSTLYLGLFSAAFLLSLITIIVGAHCNNARFNHLSVLFQLSSSGPSEEKQKKNSVEEAESKSSMGLQIFLR
jgi:hypothetical protein